MHLQTIDWIIIASFLIISFLIGIYYRKESSKSLSNFFLGGRKLPWYLAGISMVATTFAADTPLAVTELVGQKGIAGNWLWWNFLLGGMLTTFFFSRLWYKANVLTEIELIELRYSGKHAALLRGFKAIYLGLIINCLIIGWVNVALAEILKVYFDLNQWEAFVWVGIFMIITVIYTSIGGLKGIAVTDVLQFGIAMFGCIILAYIVLQSEKIGGISGLKDKLPEKTFSFFPEIGTKDTAGVYVLGIGAFLAHIAVQWWASWYPGAEPGGGGYVVQRMMSTRNEKESIYATLFFQIAHYCLRPWPWIIIALCSMVLYPELTHDNKKAGFVMTMKDFLPPGLQGLMLVAFFAAYMSTISTQLNWGASYLVNDLIKRFRVPHDAENEEAIMVRYAKISTFVIMLLGLLVSTQITRISDIWSFIIECGAGLGLVLILRWYWWRINAWSEISATIAPFIFYALSRYVLNLEFPDSFFITVGFTTITWITITYLTKPEKTETLQKFYKTVEPPGWWEPVRKVEGTEKRPMRYLLLCWLAAVILGYSVLFGSGKLIFQEFQSALIYFALSILCIFALRFFMQKSYK